MTQLVAGNQQMKANLHMSQTLPNLTKYCEISKPGWWVVANTLAALASFSTPDQSWTILDNSHYVKSRSPRILVSELSH